MMVWGCFSFKGRGGLFFLPKNITMTGARFKECLEEHLIPFMTHHQYTHFLQDEAPCHTSNIVMNMLRNQQFEVVD